MKKLILALPILLFFTGKSFAIHTILRNANNISAGTIDPARLPSSSATLQGNNFIYYPRGVYSVSSAIEIPYGVTAFFQDGSTLTNAGNNGVLSVSGTVRGDLTIVANGFPNVQGNLLRINTSGYIDSVTFRDGTITGDNVAGNDSPVLLTGKNAHIGRLIYQGTTISGSAGNKRFVLFSGALNSGIHGGYIEDANANPMIVFQIGESTNCIIENMEVIGAKLNYVMRPLAGTKASVGFTLKNNRFVESANGDGAGLVATGLSKNMNIIGNSFVKNGSVGDTALALATDGVSSSTLVSENFFSGFTTAISVQSGSNNTFIHGNQMENCTNGISDSGSNTKVRDNVVNGVYVADN